MTSVKLSDLQESKPLQIEVDGKKVCLAKIKGEIFAVADLCTHADAMLSEGDITDYRIECWLHGAEFDLRTGAAVTPPAVAPLETFHVYIENEIATISSVKAE